MGYGIISIDKSNLSLVEMGVLHLSKYKDHSKRLHYIFEKVSALVENYRPEAVALEAPFYGKNIQSMLKLGRAQGVAIVAAMAHGSATIEYAPRKIKQSITGNGNASKEQVLGMLQNILKFKGEPEYMDASDAVAVALCHHYQISSNMEIGGNKSSRNPWEAFIKANPNRVKSK